MDKSFTKKDLLEFISLYEFTIEDSPQKSKSELQNELLSLNGKSPIWSTEYPDIGTVEDLLLFLSKPKPNQELNYKEKQEIIFKAKKLIHYCRNGYSIAFTEYLSIDEIYEEGCRIAEHGDVPTCRRAISELNQDPKIRNKIEIKISSKIQSQLEQKKINKENLTNRVKKVDKYIKLDFS
jgi:hypothetical protein